VSQATPDDDRQTMTALARGIEVLRCFSLIDHELTSRQLGERTGLPRPTLFRVTSTLCQLGLLRQDEERGVFIPTAALLAMSAPVLARLNVRQVARPLMQRLADHVGGLVMISMGEGQELVVVETVIGVDSVVFRPEVGARLSLSRTAVGRVYLLSLPEAQQEAYLRRVEAADPARAAELRLILSANAEDIRDRGYCKAFGEVRRDVWGVAALMETPVDGRTVVFSCSVPSFSTDAERMSELGERLVGLIHGVEAQMGVVDHFAPLEFERPRARAAAAHADAKPAARKKVRSA